MQVSSGDVQNFGPYLFQAGAGWLSQFASVLSHRTAHRDCLLEKRSRQSLFSACQLLDIDSASPYALQFQ
jgi:hypothetical protein